MTLTGRSRHRLAGALVATAIGAALVPAGAALPDPLVVERLGRERGFPSETITAVHRDRFGFLWVGSREGLAMWDGYDVRVFQHSVSDPTSLADDAVRRIYEGPSGSLWIGLDAGGLQRLDRATGRFESWRHDPDDPESLSHDAVYAIAEGDDGTLWVGTQTGLDRLEIESGKVERFVADPDDPEALPSAWVYDVHRDGAGRIWVATVGGGVAWLEPESRRFTRVPFSVAAEVTERSVLTYALAEGPAGAVWVGGEEGVFRYDDATATLHRVPLLEPPSGPDLAIVTAIAFDGAGTLWATTWNSGLIGYETTTGVSRHYRQVPGREEGLSSDRLAALFIDAGGEVWVGSWGEGIDRFSSDAGPFSIIVERDDGTGLPYPDVTSVLEDREGRLWVGTWGEGLCRRDAGATTFSCDSRPELTTPLSLAEGTDGDLWVGTMSGLYDLAENGDVRRAFRQSASRADGLGPGYVNALAADLTGRLWIGSGGDGAYLLEDADGRLARFGNDASDPASLSDDHVTAVRVASDGAVWIGTRAGGLNRLDPSTGGAVRFLPDPEDPRSLGHHTVTSILEGRDGIVWAGTAGGGLARVARDAEGEWDVRRVSVEDGLVNASVVSIEQDDDGSLWIGTRRGLSRFEPGSGRFRNYGPGDGLPSLEFRPNAQSSSAKHLYFGTTGGVLAIDRGSTFVPPDPTPTLVTALRTLEGPLPTPYAPWETSKIELPYGTMVSVEFGVLDLRPPHRFEYRLEGRSEAWVDLGRRREITFAGLPPDRYVLRARGLNARGAWSESAVPLVIRVLPPFWMTWWFRALVVIAVVGIAWTWIHVRVNALARRNRELEALHREREAALEQARASEVALQGAYERLRDLTRRLEDAKEGERHRIARELHDDMGQALSAVKINLKALGRTADDDRTGERVADALTLVDGIIRHVRSLSLDLRPPLLDELGLVAALRGYAESQSIRSGVEIGVEANADAEDVPAEIAIAAFRIVQESIHNVVRHAGARRVTVSVRRDPGRLMLVVHDDGRGFDVGRALERAATGRHLGLLGMRERVEALGGRFDVTSEDGHGTTVRARIPIDGEEGRP